MKIKNTAKIMYKIAGLVLLLFCCNCVQKQSGALNGISLRTFPYPYKAALTIADDIDRQDWQDFKYIQAFYNEHDLEIGESFWMYHDTDVYPAPEIEFSYFKGISKEKSEFAADMTQFIRAGVFDALHTFEQTQPYEFSHLTRDDYRYAIKELRDNIGVNLTHWINHGDSPDKIGPDEANIGDNPGSKYYHTDFTNAGKSDGSYSFKFYHTWDGSYNDPCYEAPENVLVLSTLDDGGKAYTYSRYHGVVDPPRSNELHLQLSDANLSSLVKNNGVTIIYMHLGTVDVGKVSEDNYDHGIDEVYPPLDAKGEQQLVALSKLSRKGDIYVTTSSKLLQYLLSWQRLDYTIDGDTIIINAIDDEVRGRYLPDMVDLQGITFYASDPQKLKVFIGEEDVTERMVLNPSDGVAKSISFPLIRITRPDDYPVLFVNVESTIYSAGGVFLSVSYNESITNKKMKTRVHLGVSLPFNSGEVTILPKQYNSRKIVFETQGNSPAMTLSVYDSSGEFRVSNGNRYALTHEGEKLAVQVASENKVIFTDVPVGGTFEIVKTK